MLIARFGLIVPVLAMAGSLSHKKIVPASSGTLPSHTPLVYRLADRSHYHRRSHQFFTCSGFRTNCSTIAVWHRKVVLMKRNESFLSNNNAVLYRRAILEALRN